MCSLYPETVVETLAFLQSCVAYEEAGKDLSPVTQATSTQFIPRFTLGKMAGGAVAMSLLATVLTHGRVAAGDVTPISQTVELGSLLDGAAAAILQHKLPVHATHMVLKLSERRVFVFQGQQELANYPVGVGRPGWETPLGKFQVRTMLENPGWTHPFTGEVMSPDSDNPLGERWIEFWTDGLNSIGFHGTSQRESVGEAVSHGCVRMYNEDIEELYEWVSRDTEVIVQQ